MRGTVKLHGTHADIVARPREDSVWYQSRTRRLTLENDNHWCCKFFTDRQDAVGKSIANICSQRNSDQLPEDVVISGEYCGCGIQKAVAISQLDKRFVIFAVKVDSEWQQLSHYDLNVGSDIYSIERAPTYSVTIDMSNPQPAIDKMKALTDAVVAECPFAATFGVNGPGEGIVWTCTDLPSNDYWFKTKNEAYMVSQSQSLRARTPEQQEQMKSVRGFFDSVLLEPRLMQGLDYLTEMNLAVETKNVSQFMQWVTDDVMKEEADAEALQTLPVRDVHREVGRRAKAWYIAHCKANQASGDVE